MHNKHLSEMDIAQGIFLDAGLLDWLENNADFTPQDRLDDIKALMKERQKNNAQFTFSEACYEMLETISNTGTLHLAKKKKYTQD